MNDEIMTATLNRLREIVSREPWSEDELAEWANEFLGACDDNGMWEQVDRERRRQEQQIPELRPQVGPYRHDPALPALPDPPDGQLHGVGFIYDEDRDDRVLVAIDRLKDNPDVVALAEHEGGLKIYSRLPVGRTSMLVCEDEWVVTEFVPYQGRWTEVTPDFKKDCVAQVLNHHEKAWQGDPPTARQLAYLRALGYEGPEPRSKGEAGALIAEYKAKKGKE
jgi:hypothetical protein